jgi:flagellin
MTLSIKSNYAAEVAQNNLRTNDMNAARSIAKLSSGLRVNNAKDDAASLAIGSRLTADVAGLRQASINASQAGSMLQIADGAYATISAILTRASTLAIQASSGQLGGSQRASLNLEFQNLMQEIDRISRDTEFNGVNLIKGGALRKALIAKDLSPNGLSAFTFGNNAIDDAAYRIDYDAFTETMTLTQLAQATGHKMVPAAYLATRGIKVEASSEIADDTTFTLAYDGTDTFTIVNQSTGTTTAVEITDAWNAAVGTTTTVLTGNQKVVVDLTTTVGIKLTLQPSFDRGQAVSAAANTLSLFTATGILPALAGAGAVSTQTAALDDIRADALNAWQSLLTFDPSNMSAKFDLEVMSGTAVGLRGVTGLRFGATINSLGAAGAGFAVNDNALTDFVVADADGNLIAAITGLNVDYTVGANAVGTYAGTLQIALTSLSDTAVKTTTRIAGQSQGIDITTVLDDAAGAGKNLGFGQTAEVNFSSLGVAIRLDGNFNRQQPIKQNLSVDGAVAASLATIANWAGANPPAPVQLYDAAIRKDVINALADAGLLDRNTGDLTLKMIVTDASGADTENLRFKGTANIGWSRVESGGNNLETGAGAHSAAITTANTAAVDRMFELRVQTDAGLFRVARIAFNVNDVNAALTAAANNTETSIKVKGFGDGLVINDTTLESGKVSLNFKLGTGVDTLADDFNISIGAATVEALGLIGAKIDGSDGTNANAAIQTTQESITRLGDIRAIVGAAQNRLDYASANLGTSIENGEAARSQLMDLDIAMEISRFTSLQLMQQAGVSALAQANQLPQNLLRLLQ